jgi:hypothetical protein
MTSWSFATADCRRRRGEHNKPPSVDTRDTSAGSGPSGPLNKKNAEPSSEMHPENPLFFKKKEKG